MKIAVFAHQKNTSALRRQIQEEGFELTIKKPDVVFSVGGDGTFLYAERAYPGVPKILIRDSKVGYLGTDRDIKTILRGIRQKRISIKKIGKLEARNKTALNEVNVRNKDQRRALRFSLSINNKTLPREFIGDGIVIATSFGSSGYFHSITGRSFKKGIGISFNNSTTAQKPLILNSHAKITVKILRGDAQVSFDNDPQMKVVRTGEKITIRQSKECACILTI